MPVLHLAPLHGVTNRVFRKAYFNHFPGFDSALAPFILSVPVSRMKENHFKDLFPPSEAVDGPSFRSGANVQIPLVPQILGSDAEDFVSTAKVLADLGYGEVNWNLGCPYPMVTKKGRGSGLLPHPDRIARFLDAACARAGIPVSVKLRLGLSDSGEILRLMPILNGYPLVRVIIHPRIGIQMYWGEVDLEGFERAARLCAHKLVYNGDVKDMASFESLKNRFPAIREWMIGRWALYDPFLPAAIKGLDPVLDPLGTVRTFHDELYDAYRSVLCGPAHTLDKMKEVWSYLGKSVIGARSSLDAVSRAKSFAQYDEAVREVFSDGSWRGRILGPKGQAEGKRA